MEVIVNGRQAGKTYRLVEWVKQGEQIDSYPGWSRVIVVQSVGEALLLRRDYGLNVRQVLSLKEWGENRAGNSQVEIALDNADLVLGEILRKLPSVVSITGRVG